MPTYPVPLAVTRAAGRALLLHQQYPDVEDVHGVSLARRLQGGTVDADTLAKMYRFFRRHARAYAGALGHLRTERDSAVVRSWALHGAEAGRAFAARQYRVLVRDGTLPPDPVEGLFDLTPEQIYARFQVAAWRWEYDLTPAKAAAFVQQYTEATGQQLELPRAFGRAARAVGDQLWRRYHGPSLFQQARKALRVDDWSLQQAAQRDLAAFRADPGPLAPARTGAGDTWPLLVAYMILAVEAPQFLAEVPQADVEAVYRLYFTPAGRRHRPQTHLDRTLARLWAHAQQGVPLSPVSTWQAMQTASEWVHRHRVRGHPFASASNLLAHHWARRDWPAVLDTLPAGAALRPAFAQFVAAQGAA